MPGWRLSSSDTMGFDKQCLRSFTIMALGMKQKVTSERDILSFAYSGVESLEAPRAPPLPRKSYRLQARRVCCSSCTSGRLTISVATDTVAHVRPSID